MSSFKSLFLLLSLLSLSQAQITVSGSGTISSAPDTASISTGVTTTATTAAAALTANNAASRRQLRLLIRLGISQRDIQTTFFNVNPQFSRPSDDSPRKIVGYRVTNDLRVVVRNISKLGSILDALVRAGSTDVGGVSFSIEDRTALLATARKRAVEDATLKANTFAAAAGVKVGKLMEIAEPGTGGGFSGATRVAKFDSSVPIATGELEVGASVVLSFAIA